MYKLNMELKNGIKLKLEIPAELVSTMDVERPIIVGDVNGDGEVNNIDAALIYAHVNGKHTLTAEQLKAADVNGDGEVSYLDAMSIMDNLAK